MKHALPALLLLLISTPVFGQDTIRWVDMDFPPFFISEGPAAGEGIGDRITDLLSRELVGFRHERDRASPDRIVGLIAAEEPVCSVAFLYTPERAEKMAFSKADMILPPNGLIVRRDDERWDPSRALSLADLLAEGSVRVGTAAGRSYGVTLDPILEGAPRGTVVPRQGDDILRGLLQMLVRNRVDAVVGYPYEATWIADQLELTEDITFIPLLEVEDFLPAHVVCPKSDWGRQVLAQVDEILIRERTKPEYRAIVERWIPADRIEDLRQAWSVAFSLD